MRVRVGTSGFAYKEWKGTFYPDDLPAAKMLRFYADRFDTVEINNTFYRMPQPSVLQGWANEVPGPFAFALKAPMWITHLRKLEELQDPARQFFAMAVETMAAHLAPVLLHLPAYLKRDPENLERVRKFFDLVPEGVRIAFEPSDESWHHEELYALLRENNAALAAVDDAKKHWAAPCPLVATASWGYVRLRKVRYKRPDLAKWVEAIAAQPWSEAFVFFKHEDGGTGPQLGKRLQDLLAAGRAP